MRPRILRGVLIALLSDIHANGPAMTAVSAAIRREGATDVLVAGDSVGYYYWPKAVLQELRDLNATMIRGNHEDRLADARRRGAPSSGSGPQHGSANALALEQLSEEELDELEALPTTISVPTPSGAVFVCHGSPVDPVRYVYPDTDASELTAMTPADHRWVVMGHTHYPMHRSIGSVSFINPGSVGQPRNGVRGASWALLDTDSEDVAFFVESYDWDAVREEALARDPELPYLGDVLVRQR